MDLRAFVRNKNHDIAATLVTLIIFRSIKNDVVQFHLGCSTAFYLYGKLWRQFEGVFGKDFTLLNC